MQITWERFARKHRDEGLDTRRVTCFFCQRTLTVKTIFPKNEDGRNSCNFWRPWSQTKWDEFSDLRARFRMTKTNIKSREKSNSPWKSYNEEERRVIIVRLTLESQLTALSHRERKTKLSGQVGESEISREMERDFPWPGEIDNTRERKVKHLDQKIQGKLKREIEVSDIPEVMIEDTKIGWWCQNQTQESFHTTPQSQGRRKSDDRVQEEMQQNVEETQERVLESEEHLCRELEEYMYSWESESRRFPPISARRSDKWFRVWESGKCFHRSSGENTFAGMEQNHEIDQSLDWKGRGWKFLELVWELLVTSLLAMSDLVEWSGGFDVMSADGRCGDSCSWMDHRGGDDQVSEVIYVDLRCSAGNGRTTKPWNISGVRFGMRWTKNGLSICTVKETVQSCENRSGKKRKWLIGFTFCCGTGERSEQMKASEISEMSQSLPGTSSMTWRV